MSGRGVGGRPVALTTMCGIIAILRRPSARPVPSAQPVLEALDGAVDTLRRATMMLDPSALPALQEAAGSLELVGCTLQGSPGVSCLVSAPDLSVADAVAERVAEIEGLVASMDSRLDEGETPFGPGELEAVNAALIVVKDAAWAIGRDRVRAARAIAALCPGALSRDGRLSPAAIDALWAVQTALSSLDRLEVRGRDSAGLHLLISGHGLDLASPELRSMVAARVLRSPVLLHGRAHAEGEAEPGVQGGRRGGRAGRQHPGPAGGYQLGSPARPRPGQSLGALHRDRAHPLGQCRGDLPGQRPPVELRRGGTDRWPLCRRRPERRCRQLCTSCGQSTTCGCLRR